MSRNDFGRFGSLILQPFYKVTVPGALSANLFSLGSRNAHFDFRIFRILFLSEIA
jgi:hypothetical protein